MLMAVVVLASGCSPGDETLVVGAIYPLSGSQGPGGIDEHRGVLLAAELANTNGGPHGRRIEVRSVDVSASDAVPAAIHRLAQDGVEMVLGSYGSTISLPAGRESARRGMLYWETGAVGEMSGTEAGRLMFRVAPSGAVLGRSAIAFISDRLAPMLDRRPETLRFAVANVDDEYGRAVAAGALSEISERGLPLAGSFPYPVPGADFPALLDRIERSGADVLFVAAYLEDGVEIRLESVRQDVPLAATIGTSSSYCMPEFGARVGEAAVGVFASDKPDAGGLDPRGLTAEGRDLLARAGAEYRERYDEDMSAAALAGFSAAWALFAEVMPAAESLTPEAVARAALRTDLPRGSLPNGSGLLFGEPGTPDAGSNLLAASVIWEWVAPGERAVVWPPQYATAEVQPLSFSP
jgi:branched-chain amino acid transport system substrate-binding protein